MVGRGDVEDDDRRRAHAAGLTDADLLQLVAECTFAGLVGTIDHLAGHVPLDPFLLPRLWKAGVDRSASRIAPLHAGVDVTPRTVAAVADPCAAMRSFVDAYGAGDVETMRAALADGFVGYVTNAAAGVERVDGPDAYLTRLPVLASTAAITQTVAVAADQALTMVEIHARREARELHNFGAFLSRHDAEGRVVELWMVDARPAYSDEFWS